MKKRGNTTQSTIQRGARREGGTEAVERVLALDVGQGDLGDDQQEDCLADRRRRGRGRCRSAIFRRSDSDRAPEDRIRMTERAGANGSFTDRNPEFAAENEVEHVDRPRLRLDEQVA